VKCSIELRFSRTSAKDYHHFLLLWRGWFCLDDDRLVMTFSIPFDDRLSSAAAVVMFPAVKKLILIFCSHFLSASEISAPVVIERIFLFLMSLFRYLTIPLELN
jgi:hypothetical protein